MKNIEFNQKHIVILHEMIMRNSVFLIGKFVIKAKKPQACNIQSNRIAQKGICHWLPKSLSETDETHFTI